MTEVWIGEMMSARPVWWIESELGKSGESQKGGRILRPNEQDRLGAFWQVFWRGKEDWQVGGWAQVRHSILMIAQVWCVVLDNVFSNYNNFHNLIWSDWPKIIVDAVTICMHANGPKIATPDDTPRSIQRTDITVWPIWTLCMTMVT